MKDVVGLVRKIDSLGRVVIPKEMREQLGIGDNCQLSFMIRSDYITIKPIKDVKLCPACQHSVASDDNFCSKCGTKLN